MEGEGDAAVGLLDFVLSGGARNVEQLVQVFAEFVSWVRHGRRVGDEIFVRTTVHFLFIRVYAYGMVCLCDISMRCLLDPNFFIT